MSDSDPVSDPAQVIGVAPDGAVTTMPPCGRAYRSAGRSAAAYRNARKTALCSPVNALAPRGVALARPGGGNGPKCGFTYSQTVWPAGVTSKRQPKAPSVINVLLFGRRCAPEMYQLKKSLNF
jgi:hypothetical protein